MKPSALVSFWPGLHPLCSTRPCLTTSLIQPATAHYKHIFSSFFLFFFFLVSPLFQLFSVQIQLTPATGQRVQIGRPLAFWIFHSETDLSAYVICFPKVPKTLGLRRPCQQMLLFFFIWTPRQPFLFSRRFTLNLRSPFNLQWKAPAFPPPKKVRSRKVAFSLS